ncbi:MAG: TetR/AcrR family transcriptional regulator [Sporolactobacillus sp.]|uniref:TetR/AcrR family transcriptional regulator n=1 Tax=Sporolactobacillus sp. STSJ-5 TaxID=2965076 RepID=UPI002107ECA7|nr:TetR/AcrR family transcriptional regulator [Sporolactobacillus sp. STSJ-5]MCQ2010142.1 TetR/AcrR family transcriptional regulator [Sporolactobacillus sp. STSJ-5]
MTRAEEYKRTRQKIIQTANKLFMDKGYNAVSTREIAKQCSLTQPALYHHFPDKESIYLAALRYVTADIRQEFKNLKRDTDRPEIALKKMLMVLIQKHPTNIMMMIQDIVNEMNQENQHMLYELWQQTYLNPFKELFAKWEKQGILREQINSDAAARFCLSSIVPLTSTHVENEAEPSLSDRLSAIIDFLLHGLLN